MVGEPYLVGEPYDIEMENGFLFNFLKSQFGFIIPGMEGPSNKKANTPAYAESRPLWNRQIAGSNMYAHVG